MVKCFFCGSEESIHIGVHFIKNDGSVNYFCSSKCQKNYDLGRDKRKLKWTEGYRLAAAKAKLQKAAIAEKKQ